MRPWAVSYENDKSTFSGQRERRDGRFPSASSRSFVFSLRKQAELAVARAGGQKFRNRSQSARGLDRPSCEIAPPLESDRGSNRADPKMERSSRVVTLLTLGDPRIDPRIAAHCRCLASRTIPAPCRTWINVFWETILLIRSSPDSSTYTRGSTRLST